MPIQTLLGYDVRGDEPIDQRIITSDRTALQGAYNGIVVYDTTASDLFVLEDTSTPPDATVESNWRRIGGGISDIDQAKLDNITVTNAVNLDLIPAIATAAIVGGNTLEETQPDNTTSNGTVRINRADFNTATAMSLLRDDRSYFITET